jgi:hypothetical protein
VLGWYKSIKFSKIQQNSAKFSKIQQNSAKFSKNRQKIRLKAAAISIQESEYASQCQVD